MLNQTRNDVGGLRPMVKTPDMTPRVHSLLEEQVKLIGELNSKLCTLEQRLHSVLEQVPDGDSAKEPISNPTTVADKVAFNNKDVDYALSQINGILNRLEV